MNKKRIRNLLLFTIFTFAILMSAGILFLAYQSAYGIVHPERLALNETPDDYGISSWRDVSFTTDDGLRLDGWLFPPEGNQGTIIFVHGHRDNRLGFINEAVMVHEQGYGVLLFDLRNSGTSEGDITTLGYYESQDVITAYDWLMTQPDVDADQIVLYGNSMGGVSVAMALAELTNLRGAVLDSTFTSVEDNTRDIVAQILPVTTPVTEFIMWVLERETDVNFYDLRPVDVVETADIPILVLHGSNDRLIPVENGETLFNVADNPYAFVVFDGAEHGGFYNLDPELYESTLLGFLEAVFE